MQIPSPGLGGPIRLAGARRSRIVDQARSVRALDRNETQGLFGGMTTLEQHIRYNNSARGLERNARYVKSAKGLERSARRRQRANQEKRNRNCRTQKQTPELPTGRGPGGKDSQDHISDRSY